MQDLLAFPGAPAPTFMLTIVVTAELKEPGRLKQTAVMLFAMPWPLRTRGPYFCVSLLMRKKPRLSMNELSMAGKPIRPSCFTIDGSKWKCRSSSRSGPFLTNSSWNIQKVIRTFATSEARTQPRMPSRSQ